MIAIPFAEMRAWMFEAALPAWGMRGVDAAHGGFLEELSPQGEPTACPIKRVRVQCRQTYVFSHAALLGWAPGAALSQRGYEYLLAHAWLGEEGGWAKQLTREGAVHDATPDLYDLAFVLFAMSWRHRLTRDPESLDFAHRTLDFIERRMRAPDGGFHARLPAPTQRLQNPHMHLTEAAVAAFEASGDERFLDLAHELVALFRSRFFDGASLGERFNADWSRAVGPLEPGHHFEWGWILGQYARLAGADVNAEIAALVEFAERRGVDPVTGAVVNAVAPESAQASGPARAWPTTERIKGWLALYEHAGRDPRAPVAAAARLLLDRYIGASTPGLWTDEFDGAAAPIAAPAPASIVYHLFLAFAEALRLEPALASHTR